MENKALDAFGKIAYDTHVGLSIKQQGDNYFKLEVTEWHELPASSQEHWRKIASAVIKASWDINCSDLE